VHGNYLKRSITLQGLDPENLPIADKSSMNFAGTRVKAWKDIWGAGQGVGNIHDVPPARELVERLCAEYAQAKARLLGESAVASVSPPPLRSGGGLGRGQL